MWLLGDENLANGYHLSLPAILWKSHGYLVLTFEIYIYI